MTAVPSIRGRLSQALVVVSLAWAVAVSAAVWLVVRHEIDELMDTTLVEAAEILHGLLAYRLAQAPMPPGAVPPTPDHEEHLIWQLVGADGRVQLRSHRAPAMPLHDPAVRGLVGLADDGRVHLAAFGQAGQVLLVAQPGAERAEARLEAARYTAGAALAVGLVCALWLMARVRRELRPVSALSDAVRLYDPLDATAQLADAQRAELQPMHAAITSLGARLARRVASERAFNAHAAHALRTPLAGIVAQLAAAQKVSPASAQPMLTLARQAADRLRYVVGALLTLFRTGGDVRWQAIDLAGLVAHLPITGLAISVEAGASLQADTDLLAAALLNLLENAQRHGARQARLSVQRADDGLLSLVVQDDGSGIDAARRQRLNAALQQQQYEGQTGLGLMQADLVARAHHGSLRIEACGAGCRIVMDLRPPAAATATAATAAGAG